MAGYGDDTAFAAWLTANGYSLPGSAPTPAILRQRGSDYIDGLYGSRARGVPTGGFAQERAQPRTGATVYGSAIPNDIIPAAWLNASYHAAYYEATKPGGLSAATSSAKSVKREKIEGAVEREYFEGSGSAIERATIVFSAVEGLLAPYLEPDEPVPAFGILSLGRRC